jgi:hypothetical protein
LNYIGGHSNHLRKVSISSDLGFELVAMPATINKKDLPPLNFTKYCRTSLIDESH